MGEAVEADLIDILDQPSFPPEKAADYDLLGLGSGIYAFRHHPRLLSFAAKLPAGAAQAFIFSTRGFGQPGPYHFALRRRLEARRWPILGEFSCLGYETLGPLAWVGGINAGNPDEADLERARVFVRTTLEDAQRSTRSSR